MPEIVRDSKTEIVRVTSTSPTVNIAIRSASASLTRKDTFLELLRSTRARIGNNGCEVPRAVFKNLHDIGTRSIPVDTLEANGVDLSALKIPIPRL